MSVAAVLYGIAVVGLIYKIGRWLVVGEQRPIPFISKDWL